jgi:hypothetical protein
MPTVYLKNGFRFHFYSLENGEPPHIHVTKAGIRAKLWLEPVRWDYDRGFSPADRRFIEKVVNEKANEFIKAYNDWFAN